MTEIEVIVGGNYGSEGKGHLCAQRVLDATQNHQPVYNVRVGGPNAGHTAVTRDGTPVAFRHVPVGALYPEQDDIHLMLAAGSEIDLQVLQDELQRLHQMFGNPTRVYVDKNATVLEPRHIEQEQKSSLNAQTGSTVKGVGAARADRIWRTAQTISQYADQDQNQDQINTLENLGLRITDVTQILQQLTTGEPVNARIVIEGTQGYELGLHTEHYPQTTSNDCRAIDFLSQTGISPWATNTQTTVWIAARVYPIRVAGNSGQMSGGETNWEQLGLPPEHTTVTKKTRRVGYFDPQQLEQALIGNGASLHGRNTNVRLALTMVDQIDPQIAGATDPRDLRTEPLTQWLLQLGPIARQHLSAMTTSDRTIAYLGSYTQDPLPLDEDITDWWETEGHLRDWWERQAQAEIEQYAPKAAEYGQQSLQQLGETLNQAGIEGDPIELAIWVYTVGKLTRWNAATSQGTPVSDDTLHDIATYVKMVQYRRHTTGDTK